MRIAVVGVGAVGGHIAARLAAVGADVTAVARGPVLEAIRQRGLVLEAGGERVEARMPATDRPAEVGPVDVAIVTVKATDPAGLAATLAPLVGPSTAVVFAQNGMPWWYGIGLAASRPRPPDLSRLDPGSRLARLVRPQQIIGGIIHSSNEMVEPGVVVNDSPGANTLHIGWADDREGGVVADLRALLEHAKMTSPANGDIRYAIWRKLAINMSASVLCLIVGQRATVIRDDAEIAALYGTLIKEAHAIAAAYGVALSAADPENFRRNAPDHLPSIRQDYERGRALETEALIAAPMAFARSAGVSAPHLETIAAIALRMARDRAKA